MIVVNARFLTQRVTGVQRFAIELSLRLKGILANDVLFVAPNNIVNEDVKVRLNVKVIGVSTGHLWEQVDLPLWLKRHGRPLLLCFGNTAPVWYKNKIDTLHDITFKRYPKTFSWKFRTLYDLMIPLILRTSRHVFSVSEFSIMEIADYYAYPRRRMSVIYNAVDKGFRNIEDSSLKEKKYIFAVSSVKENKNFIVALEAFIKAQKRIKGLKLYIAGDLKANSFRGVDLSTYESNPNIIFLGRISDEELIRYYSNAEAFIFPSLYEGFGIPVLEAQACGCPVISSNSSSLSEVLGNSALMCNPHSVSEFADAIIKLQSSSTLRTDLMERGKLNVARFSWEDSARRVIAVVNKLSRLP